MSLPTALSPLGLDRNEGFRGESSPHEPLATAVSADRLRRYPDASALEELLAERLGITSESVAVTAGGDDALERIIRFAVPASATAVVTDPTFGLIADLLARRSITCRTVPWSDGPFPLAAFVDACSGADTAFVVSPNNPTGLVLSAEDLRRLRAAAPDPLLVLDAAYDEFAAESLTHTALGLPRTLLVGTLSKAWALAGLRIGFLAGPPALVAALRAAALPFPVATPSLAIAAEALVSEEPAMRRRVAAVREERTTLRREVLEAGFAVPASQANFLLARGPRAGFLAAGLAALGIRVRTFTEPSLADAVRVTLPGEASLFARLRSACRTVLDPEAILLDLDGVLADVSGSYREAIRATAASFGIGVSPEEIAAAKRAGDANNDWRLTQSLLAARGVSATLDEVTARFERTYQGTHAEPGLRRTERVLVDRRQIAAIKGTRPLAVVTGRPRRDAVRFLAESGLDGLVDRLVAMEDAPAKPDPAPIRLACAQLGVRRAWMVGDTVDDVRAALAAWPEPEVLPIGVLAPGAGQADDGLALRRAGAAAVLPAIASLQELLP